MVFFASRSMGAPLVVLDVPLLYETVGDAACDFVIYVMLTARQRIVAWREAV